MRTVKVIKTTCPLMGEEGYLLEGTYPSEELMIAADIEGYLTTHDILEHRDESSIGGVANELEALGAMWYIRGQDGDFRRNGRPSSLDPYQVLTNDLLGIVSHVLNDGCEIPVANEDVSEDFVWVRNLFAKSMLKEFHDNEIGHEERVILCKYLKRVAVHMQNGYDWAADHYQHIDINSMFHNMAEDIGHMMNADYNEFNVSYCVASGDYSVDEIKYDEDGYEMAA